MTHVTQTTQATSVTSHDSQLRRRWLNYYTASIAYKNQQNFDII